VLERAKFDAPRHARPEANASPGVSKEAPGAPPNRSRPPVFAHNFLRDIAATYDSFVVKRTPPKGPGLAKTRELRLVSSREIEVWRSADYRLRELFEVADVMSEGAVRNELDGSAYYGTTSLLLPFVSRGGLLPDELAQGAARLIGRDIHARVRAIRIACREAQVRSVEPLGRVRAELVVRHDSRGVRIDIDVEARVLVSERRALPRRRVRH
jgi:hypothetical protein